VVVVKTDGASDEDIVKAFKDSKFGVTVKKTKKE